MTFELLNYGIFWHNKIITLEEHIIVRKGQRKILLLDLSDGFAKNKKVRSPDLNFCTIASHPCTGQWDGGPMAPPLKVHVLHLDSRLEVRQPSLEVSMLPLSHGASLEVGVAIPLEVLWCCPSMSMRHSSRSPGAAPWGPMAPPSRSEVHHPPHCCKAWNLWIGIYNGEVVFNRELSNCWSDLDDFFGRPIMKFWFW